MEVTEVAHYSDEGTIAGPANFHNGRTGKLSCHVPIQSIFACQCTEPCMCHSIQVEVEGEQFITVFGYVF